MRQRESPTLAITSLLGVTASITHAVVPVVATNRVLDICTVNRFTSHGGVGLVHLADRCNSKWLHWGCAYLQNMQKR